MAGVKTRHKRKTFIMCVLCVMVLLMMIIRVGYLMISCSQHYTELAEELHERERDIKAARGRIIDRNGVVLADNETVCTVSVIYNQIKEPEKVIAALAKELNLSEEYVRKRVEKYSSRERIKSNVDKETGDRIRNMDLAGVKVDEDYKRYYPYGSLASKVLGFTGADNQGIIGLEVKYEEYLTGLKGKILTVTDARGVEIEDVGEKRREPVAGGDLHISIDANIQQYATQLALQTYETKQADAVSMIVMDVNNGELLAMADVPEFDLNDPFTLQEIYVQESTHKEEGEAVKAPSQQDLLNAMWRNGCINDTYEPGSVFKIITTAAGLEEGVVTLEEGFHCPGYTTVDDRRIRCHKVSGHGSQTFLEAFGNSCNPVFINLGLRIGAERYFDYFSKFQLMNKTGIDLPGEAGTIMHKLENVGNVELATISFGQSFQITPVRLMATVAGIINGGNTVTPHFGRYVISEDKETIEEFVYPQVEGIVSEDTSKKLRLMLEKVVSEGGGSKAYIEGFEIGGKTATSQTLPRSSGRYIASFLGFWPASNPKVMALVIIDHPKGMYYGGQIAAPVVKELFENILPYLEDMDYNG
ncbi:MAG: peptidoglycan glycosyltransferase [Lachnospiraceae bacterium]|nr:peptidoglycan glycosyltransferase [Lachnospiraceae bacterium]